MLQENFYRECVDLKTWWIIKIPQQYKLGAICLSNLTKAYPGVTVKTGHSSKLIAGHNEWITRPSTCSTVELHGWQKFVADTIPQELCIK